MDRGSSVHIMEAMGQAFPRRLAHVGDSEPSPRAAARDVRAPRCRESRGGATSTGSRRQ